MEEASLQGIGDPEAGVWFPVAEDGGVWTKESQSPPPPLAQSLKANI